MKFIFTFVVTGMIPGGNGFTLCGLPGTPQLLGSPKNINHFVSSPASTLPLHAEPMLRRMGGSEDMPYFFRASALRSPQASTSERSEHDSWDQPPSRTLSPSGILDPKVINAIMDLVGPDDDQLGDFFTDYTSAGPMASMQHLGRPGVATRLSALMGVVISDAPRKSGAPKLGGWGSNSYSSS